MFLKDPDAVLDYAVDWTASCGDRRTISTSSWAAAPPGLALSGMTQAPTLTAVRLGGGLAGGLYRVANRVTFSDSLVEERSILLRVEQR